MELFNLNPSGIYLFNYVFATKIILLHTHQWRHISGDEHCYIEYSASQLPIRAYRLFLKREILVNL